MGGRRREGEGKERSDEGSEEETGGGIEGGRKGRTEDAGKGMRGSNRVQVIKGISKSRIVLKIRANAIVFAFEISSCGSGKLFTSKYV